MVWILGVLLLVVPAAELWVVVVLGFSWGGAAFWCAGTAAVGWWFARRENLSLWTELESDVQNGRVPTIEGIDTMLMLLGAWGLIVPGLLTDLAGGAVLLPPLRRVLTDLARRAIRATFLS